MNNGISNCYGRGLKERLSIKKQKWKFGILSIFFKFHFQIFSKNFASHDNFLKINSKSPAPCLSFLSSLHVPSCSLILFFSLTHNIYYLLLLFGGIRCGNYESTAQEMTPEGIILNYLSSTSEKKKRENFFLLRHHIICDQQPTNINSTLHVRWNH